MNAFNRRLKEACDKLEIAPEGERNNEANKQAFRVGAALHWTGSNRAHAESELRAAAERTGLPAKEARNCVRSGLKTRTRHDEPAQAPEDTESHIRPRADVRHNEIAPTPKRRDRARTWEQLAPIEPGGEVEAHLIERGIDPNAVRAMDLARELPPGAEHRGMSFGKAPWAESGHRLICPQFDANGRLVNMMGRKRKPAPDEEKKTLAMGGVTGGAHIQACPTGRALLAGRAWAVEAVKRRGVVVPEGEFDVLTWAHRGTESPVVMGSKHWSQEHADRIPDGTKVFLRPDNDEAGRKTAHKVAASLYGRCTVYAPPLPLWGDHDDNARHNAGTLPVHPLDDSEVYYLWRNGAPAPCVVAKDKAEARAELREGLAELSKPYDGPPRIADVNADTGAGKTHAQTRETILALTRGMSARWAAPTDKFIRETLEEFRGAAAELRIAGEITDDERVKLLTTFTRATDVGRNEQSCTYFDHVGAASRATPNGGGILCGACPFKGDCLKKTNGYMRRKEAMRVERPYNFAITTHAKEALQGEDAEPVDLLVIDEDPSGSLLSEERFTAAHLARWFNDGDLGELSEDAKNQLLALLADSESQKGAPLPSNILDGADLGETANTSAQLLKTIRRDGEIASKDTWDSIQKAPSWRALAAFRESARRGLKGCRVENGEVVVYRRRTFEREAKTTIILDATSTPQRTAARLGNGAKHIAVRCIQKAHKVTHLTGWTPSKHNFGPEFADTWRRFNEVANEKVNAKTLVILTKPVVTLLRGMGEDAPPWFRRAECAGNVLYYGQAGSSGSNLYKDCERVLAVPFFVSKDVRLSRAAMLEHIADVELKPDDPTWTDQARYEMETSKIIQAIGRARSMVELIIMGGTRTFGFNVDESVHVDLYAWQECRGTFCPAACLDEFTRLKVAMRGGATVLSARSLSGVSQGTSETPKYIWEIPKWGGTPTEQVLVNALKDVCGGSNATWAWRAGLGRISVTTSAGVRRIAYTSEHGKPTPDKVRRELLSYEPGTAWFRMEHDEEGTRRELVDPIAKFDAGITALANAGEPLGVRSLARVSGVSKSATGRACKRYSAEIRERYAVAVEAAKVPRRKWVTPHAESIELRARVRSRTRDRVPPVWHSFLAEHGYLIGRVPTARGAPPTWVASPRGSSAPFPMRPN